MDAYLDIETTGLSCHRHKLTVVGLCLGNDECVTQWIGGGITADRLLKILRQKGVTTIYTYNGSRFDLPFLRYSLGLDLARGFHHEDLMLHCWDKGLYGGLKAVEKMLGIPRALTNVDGRQAVRLWRRYEQHDDNAALRVLLDYNREDVLNLRTLRELVVS